jgi:hypothetical protein
MLGFKRIRVRLTAVFARVFASFCRTFYNNPFVTVLAFTRLGSILCAVKLAAGRAYKYVLRMSFVLRKQVSGEKIIRLAALNAGMLLYPEEILYMSRS